MYLSDSYFTSLMKCNYSQKTKQKQKCEVKKVKINLKLEKTYLITLEKVQKFNPSHQNTYKQQSCRKIAQ